MTPPARDMPAWNVVADIVRQKAVAILVFAVALFLPVAVVLACNFLAPVKRAHTQELRVLLPRDQAQSNVLRYPNGNEFNKLDIIAPAVLEKVHRAHKLDRYLGFPDFQAIVTLENQNLDQARVNAEYAQKLRARNLGAIDLQQLEQQYRNALAQLDASRFNLGIERDKGAEKIPDSQIDALLYDIAEAWFDTYRVLEGRRLPKMGPENLETEALAHAETSRYQAVDYINQKIVQLRANLGEYARNLGGRSLYLDTGESIDALLIELNALSQYQMTIFSQSLVSDRSLLAPLDMVYPLGRIRQLTRERTQTEGEMRALMESLRIIDSATGEDPAHAPAESSASAVSALSAPSGVHPLSGASTLTLDSGVFQSIAAMVRQNLHAEVRQDWALKYQNYGVRLAAIDADLDYYKNINDPVVEAQKVDTELAQRYLTEAAAKLQRINERAGEFQKLLENDFRSTFRYYTPIGSPYVVKELALSPFKAVAAAGAFYFLTVLVFAVLTVYSAMPKASGGKNAPWPED